MITLMARIEQRSARIGVLGLGYVGLPLAASLAEAGFTVTGVDHDAGRVARLAAGECPIAGHEPGLAELVARVVAGRALSVTGDIAALAAADVVLVCVETPVEADHRPRYRTLRSALSGLAKVMRPGVLVIVESTLAPGTMDHVVAPLLERVSGAARSSGFYFGHCPERVMPGKLLHNLAELPRVCGGGTEATARAMACLYRTIVRGALDLADCVTAELVKTAENAYRDVNIAFANELALICEASGGDFTQVRALVNKSPGRHVLLAGAGVGGHCITKDPWLLACGAPGLEPLLIAAARARNEGMPAHVLTLVESALAEAGRGLLGARLVLLGAAYLEDSADVRHAPTQAFLAHARARGATCTVHDPLVPAHQGDLAGALRGADAAVLLVAHAAYRGLDWPTLAAELRTPVLVDARHVVSPAEARRAGLVFRALGARQPAPSAGPARPPSRQLWRRVERARRAQGKSFTSSWRVG